MAQNKDYKTALDRIATEAIEKSGDISFGDLNLQDNLPESLFKLTHLVRLSINGIFDEEGDLLYTDSKNTLSNQNIKNLNELYSLTTIDIDATGINDFRSIDKLENLIHIYASNNNITTLLSLDKVENLKTLNINNNNISNIEYISNFKNLSRLLCSGNKISDFSSLSDLRKLEMVACHGNDAKTIPSEVLSQSKFDNCWPRLDAYLGDLKKGSVEKRDVKLLILGNGRIGKTQLCRHLCGEPFIKDDISTHGIRIRKLDLSTDSTKQTFQLWDFGGQDIYFSTHALFLRGRAVIVLAWNCEAEYDEVHVYKGIQHKNEKLDWWLDLIQRYADKNPPLVLVQTKCDTAMREISPPPLADHKRLEKFDFKPNRHVDSESGRGYSTLNETLVEAANHVQETQGTTTQALGRAQVIEELQRQISLLTEESSSKERAIEKDDFIQICDEIGGISNVDQFLAYLHAVGLVFFEDGLFENRVILDQNWALNAVYAVFDRTSAYPEISANQGQFTLEDLGKSVWKGYKKREKQLFLSMMLRCGICFPFDDKSRPEIDNKIYIAPDLLPLLKPADDVLQWDISMEVQLQTHDYGVLPSAVLRSFMAEIGAVAGVTGRYWRDGFFVYDGSRKSRGIVEKVMHDDQWRGEIQLRTQNGEAVNFLKFLIDILKNVEDKLGFRGKIRETTIELAKELKDEILGNLLDGEFDYPKIPSATFHEQPNAQREIFVSHAWKDNSVPIGEAPNTLTNFKQLLEDADSKGIEIVSDETLEVGDSITEFMRRLSNGQRVYIILSDNYLKSQNCMFELTEIWKKSTQDKSLFLDRVRIYRRADANIFTPEGRREYKEYWIKKYKAYKRSVKDELRTGQLDQSEFEALKAYERYKDAISDILNAIGSQILADDFEEFLEVTL